MFLDLPPCTGDVLQLATLSNSSLSFSTDRQSSTLSKRLVKTTRELCLVTSVVNWLTETQSLANPNF